MEHFERKSFEQFQMRTHVSIILLCNFNLAVSSAKTSLSALGLCSRLGEKKNYNDVDVVTVFIDGFISI